MPANKQPRLQIGVLVILHMVGVAGLSSSYSDWFLMLTPINLLVSAALVWWNHPAWSAKAIAVLLLSFVVGMAAEIAGVATGQIFGTYHYGNTLGLKLFEVPLVIGVNWAVLVYCSAALLHRFNWPLLAKAAVSAALMVGLDVLMEPVAIALDFWHWPEGHIPLQNYFAWFAVAFVLLVVFHNVVGPVRNRVATALFVIQCAFFGVLNVLI